MFCGYLFHRNGCTRKIHVESEFFKQRICSKCHYYRSSEPKLKAGEFCVTLYMLCLQCPYHSIILIGEEFDCFGNEGTSNVTISLCEQTAELVLHWRARGRGVLLFPADLTDLIIINFVELKETFDLAKVEVRKGFSHVRQHTDTGGKRHILY